MKVVGGILILVGFVVAFVIVVIGQIARNCENQACANIPWWLGPLIGGGIAIVGVAVGRSSEQTRRPDGLDGDHDRDPE